MDAQRTGGPGPDPRVLLDRDATTGIARITLNNPERRNTYDPEMRAIPVAASRSSRTRGSGPGPPVRCASMAHDNTLYI